MVVLGAIVAPATFPVLQASAPEIGRALAGELFGRSWHGSTTSLYAAGGVMLVSMMAMAVLGPRPRAFARAAGGDCGDAAVALYSGLIVLSTIDPSSSRLAACRHCCRKRTPGASGSTSCISCRRAA